LEVRLASVSRQATEQAEATGQTAAALREELAALRKRIEGWGEPGSAPRMAHDVEVLGEHVNRLDREVHGQLVEAVADRVTREVLDGLEQARKGRRFRK
jgi:hypothetical protein